jgi:hypothetical protein
LEYKKKIYKEKILYISKYNYFNLIIFKRWYTGPEGLKLLPSNTLKVYNPLWGSHWQSSKSYQAFITEYNSHKVYKNSNIQQNNLIIGNFNSIFNNKKNLSDSEFNKIFIDSRWFYLNGLKHPRIMEVVTNLNNLPSNSQVVINSVFITSSNNSVHFVNNIWYKPLFLCSIDFKKYYTIPVIYKEIIEYSKVVKRVIFWNKYRDETLNKQLRVTEKVIEVMQTNQFFLYDVDLWSNPNNIDKLIAMLEKNNGLPLSTDYFSKLKIIEIKDISTSLFDE